MCWGRGQVDILASREASLRKWYLSQDLKGRSESAMLVLGQRAFDAVGAANASP